tara:strand:+ start:4070 stop:4948 length:879 start_codon:yes stop_codon:yes gene_type:complete
MTAPNDKRAMPYGGAFAVQDPDVIAYIKKLNLTDSLWDDGVTQQFCSKYVNWISTTTNNTIKKLDTFNYSVFSNGTSQAFDMFYIKNKNRRFRCFKGEYIYHQLAWRNNWPNWKFIEDEKLNSNDAVVISLPFSNTGNVHENYELILHTCNALEIPVLIDCVYFGACANIEFDFTYKCITDIVFSLSKTFPVAHARIGMRLTRTDDDDLMFVYDKINYNNRLSAKMGLELIKNYSPDYTYNKYVLPQHALCNDLNITPSNTVLFGLDYNNVYPEYNRGGIINRLGLHRHYEI